jgi:hypothetical protein
MEGWKVSKPVYLDYNATTPHADTAAVAITRAVKGFRATSV